jgi:hypothetical protein
MSANRMTFDELKVALVKAERQWDAGEIDDQTFDHIAAEAAMKWARYTRDQMLGRQS